MFLCSQEKNPSEVQCANLCHLLHIMALHLYSINTLRLRKLADILPTTFSNAFSWMQMYVF